jgi:spermidine synthase
VRSRHDIVKNSPHQPELMNPKSSSDRPKKSAFARGRPVELFTSVFLTGACVMIVEILGTRVIGPVFGVSLFVWSALLAVTLGSLASGYYIGGLLVDRSPSRQLLNAATLASGVLLGVAPATRYWVLSFTQSFGPRLGPLASAVLLFAPALMALGTIGPIAVRLASDDIRSTGRRVGSLFAVSTAGSLVGTLLAGFWLIPAFEIDHILLATAGLLVVLGGMPLAFRRHPAAAAMCIPLLSGLVPDAPLPPGFRILDRAHSMYGLVEVIDDDNRQVRFMRVDHSIIGADRMPEHDSAFSFVHILELARFLRPAAHSMLQLGLGTGSLARSLDRRGIAIDIVEIDPVVVRFAQQHFQFNMAANTFVEDARAYLNRTDRRYDIVVHDTFTAGSTPEHLLSREVVARVRQILRPGGLLVLNYVGSVSGAEAAGSKLVARTLRSVFHSVRAVRDSDHEGISNIVFFASDEPLELEALGRMRLHIETLERARRVFMEREVLAAEVATSGPVITDGLNPLARLEVPVTEEHSAAMNRLLPAAVWLH